MRWPPTEERPQCGYGKRSRSGNDLLCRQDGNAADGDSPASFRSAWRCRRIRRDLGGPALPNAGHERGVEHSIRQPDHELTVQLHRQPRMDENEHDWMCNRQPLGVPGAGSDAIKIAMSASAAGRQGAAAVEVFVLPRSASRRGSGPA
jgi:hypothetical protein